MKGWETDPVFARESLTIWVSFESQLLLFSQFAATDTWKQCEVLRSGRYLRTVWFSSKLVGQFTHSLRSLNTLLGTFASSKIGWPWSWGKWASTWLALLTWSSAKTFAASRSSDWPLKIQYCTQMVWLGNGHIHWWSLSAPIRARQAAVKLQ